MGKGMQVHALLKIGSYSSTAMSHVSIGTIT